MTGEKCSHALANVLDDSAPDTPNVILDGANGDASSVAYDEHVARLKAEAEAQDKANRLRIAQEQLAEYAVQKEQDAASLVQHCEKFESALMEVLKSAQGPQVLLEQFKLLQEKLGEAAAEASAFAAQQTADVENLKRSLLKADIATDMEVSETKRAREDGEEDVADGSGEVDSSDADTMAPSSHTNSAHTSTSSSTTTMLERCKYIPLRLTHDERRLLRLLEAALNVSEYTDKVDILTWKSKTQRVHAQIKDLCSILSGLFVAQDYKRGQELVRDRNFADNAKFFQDVFEIGRRYKIMNPDKMRNEYGKLMYMLMDSADNNVQELLEFKCVKPLQTVHTFLHERSGLAMLEDPLMEVATAEVVAGNRSRHDIQREIKIKEKARETLARKYRSRDLTEEQLLWCMYSISDNNSFLLFNRDPIDRMIHYFTSTFRPDQHTPGLSLAIQGGKEGARLTHNHERQFHYVLQSLTLWREISTEMFKMWYLAESDMLKEGNMYRLTDTGQGLNRVQSAPSVGKSMHAVLARCQAKLGHWVGSAVVHLGDHNVPNALMFIDKYTQVPRILNPVILVLDELPKLCKDPDLAKYIQETFGGMEQCRRTILVDFCRHAFDGSGADNFFDAGSCIDGRLTSAWNWCSKLEKKPYFHVFRMAGFVGFDGDFK